MAVPLGATPGCFYVSGVIGYLVVLSVLFNVFFLLSCGGGVVGVVRVFINPVILLLLLLFISSNKTTTNVLTSFFRKKKLNISSLFFCEKDK